MVKAKILLQSRQNYLHAVCHAYCQCFNIVKIQKSCLNLEFLINPIFLCPKSSI
jgi:hypothetical protein